MTKRPARPSGKNSRSAYQAGKVPLERAFSKLGLASRTQARALIEGGQVKVNGQLVRDALFLVRPETAKIEIAGARAEKPGWRALVLHKPRGVVTTRADEKGRTTVFSLLGDEGAGLHAVGRLDLATSGLLILTNDTKLSAYLTDPENEIPRVYVATVRGGFGDERAARALAGVWDDGEDGKREFLQAREISVLKESGRESLVKIVLAEGKNREIRRLFLALGHEVLRLKRISYGALELGALEPGKSLPITREEIRVAFPAAPLSSLEKSDEVS